MKLEKFRHSLLRFCARGKSNRHASAAAAAATQPSYESLSAAFSADDMAALQHAVEEEQARAGAAGGVSAVETWLQLLLQLLRKTPPGRAAASSHLHAHPVIHQEMRTTLMARTGGEDDGAGGESEGAARGRGSKRNSNGGSGAAGSQSRFASAMTAALSDRDIPLHSVLKDPTVSSSCPYSPRMPRGKGVRRGGAQSKIFILF